MEGSVDSDAIAGKFMQQLYYTCVTTMFELKKSQTRYLRLRDDYCGFVLTDDLKFHTELICKVLSELKTGKADV